MTDLTGKRILVTGAAGGLGMVLVRTLVDAGASVCGMVHTAEGVASLSRTFADDDVTAVAADLRGAEGLADTVAMEAAARGDFFGLVNNAAIYPKTSAADLVPQEIADVLAVNAVAAASLVAACIPGMMQLGGGRIVNVASNTFDTGMEGLASYVASKGALIGLVRVWARELGRHGITANAVSPGAFQTDAEKIHPDPEAYSASVIEKQAIKRRGEPREFADLVAYLLSDRAGFITGQTIRIDGGVVTQ